jgi:hypothetical protein
MGNHKLYSAIARIWKRNDDKIERDGKRERWR